MYHNKLQYYHSCTTVQSKLCLVARCYVSQFILVLHHVQLHVHSSHLPAIPLHYSRQQWVHGRMCLYSSWLSLAAQTCVPPSIPTSSLITQPKVIRIPIRIRDPDSDQAQNIITFRLSPLAHAYEVWSTSTNAFVNYLADTQTHIQTNTHKLIPIPALPYIQRYIQVKQQTR